MCTHMCSYGTILFSVNTRIAFAINGTGYCKHAIKHIATPKMHRARAGRPAPSHWHWILKESLTEQVNSHWAVQG